VNEQDLLEPAPPASTVVKNCGNCGNGTPRYGGLVSCKDVPTWQMFPERTACTFTPARWVEMTPKRQAKRQAQAGIDQAVAAADRNIEGWSDTAYAFIEFYCAQNKGKRCIGHDIVQASIEKGVIQPPNSKAWGSPIQQAARAGLLKRIGYDEDPNRHNNPVPLWR
jgi:hypothetical protein